MIIPETKIKKLKEDNSFKGLVKAVADQQRQQDKDINSALGNIDESLKAVQKLAVQIKGLSRNEVSNESKIIDLQNLVAKILANVNASFDTLSKRKNLDLTDLIKSIDTLGDKMEKLGNRPNTVIEKKPTEWDFVIIRDNFGQIDKIKASNLNI